MGNFRDLGGLTRGLLLSFLVILGAPAALAQPQILKVAEGYPLGLGAGGFEAGTYEVSEAEQKSWEKLYPFVTGLITDELIVQLSRYSIESTKNFHYEPGPAPKLAVFGFNADYVVYEVTLADLPAAPAVERRLKVYLMSPNAGHQLLLNKVAITIRGQRLE